MQLTLNYSFKKPETSDNIADVINTYIPETFDEIDSMFNDYLTNVLNPQYSDLQTENSTIFSVPAGTVKGQLNATLKGRTVTNLLDDDVAGGESTSGWSTSNVSVATDNSNEFEGTNCIKVTLSAEQTSGVAYYDILPYLGTKYYLISAYVKNGNLSTGCYLRVTCSGDAGNIDASNHDGTTWLRQGVVIQPSDFANASSVYIRLKVDGAENQYGFIDAIMVNEISSTEYALGADALLDRYNWHKGTKSTLPVLIQSVGINLFNGEIINGKYIDATTGNLMTEPDQSYSPNYIKVKPNTIYTFSNTALRYARTIFYDSNKNFINGETSGDGITSFTFTTPSNCYYVRLCNGGNNYSIIQDKWQIEEGTVATEYVPYYDSKAYINWTGRSLPNGVKDELNVLDGTLTKNVSPEYTLQASDLDSLSTWRTNVDVVFTKPNFLGNSALTNDGKAIRIDGWDTIDYNNGNFDDAANIGKAVTTETNQDIGFIVEKGTYASLAEAQQDISSGGLAGITLNYQLAEPETYETNVTPIIGFENGTIIIETDGTVPTFEYKSCVNEAAQRESGVDLSNRNAKIINYNYNELLTYALLGL